MKKTATTKTVKQGCAVNGNLVEKLTLDILSERHNALARYIGIPCEVNASAMLSGAATSAGCLKKKKSYAGYRVDLQYFKGEFSKIRFRAASNGEDVVLGYIVDSDGNVESLSQADSPTIATKDPSCMDKSIPWRISNSFGFPTKNRLIIFDRRIISCFCSPILKSPSVIIFQALAAFRHHCLLD